jgi:LysM repeat protein
MLKRIIIILQLALFVILYSCKTSQPIASNIGSDVTTNDYVNRYKDLAVSEMKRTGIPASITLAQGIIESDYGRSRLAREANNHFGIKCHSDWKGPTIRHNDDRRNECFRKYRKPKDSYYDHSDFLKNGSRYNFLFKIDPTDYKAWARGLKKAGYATNPKYANMLIRKIEEDKLWYYDKGYKSSVKSSNHVVIARTNDDTGEQSVSENSGSIFNENTKLSSHIQRVNERNRIKYIIVKDGDTREKLEMEFQLLKWELPKYNECESDFLLVPGQILYLQPKRDKAEPGKEFHTFLEGETMYLISQKYGMKLKKLYEKNRTAKGNEPEAGTRIWLRSMKPVR